MPLTFVPTPLGNLEDITFRSLKTIESSEVVFCEDTRVSKKLIDLLAEKYSLNISKKFFISLHSHNEERVLEQIDKAIFDKNCIYMSDAGMPAISDPGAMLVEFARANNISYDVLPGASAVTTAYAASGFLDSKFVFYGFLPHKTSSREEELKKLSASEYPVVFYEAPHRIEQFFEELAKVDKDAEIFASKELTKLHQKYFKSTAAQFAATLKNISTKGEWVVTVKFSKQNSDMLAISLDEIMELELPKKQMAKLISKITGEAPKSIYEELIKK